MPANPFPERPTVAIDLWQGVHDQRTRGTHWHLLDVQFGSTVLYDPLPGKKACPIHVDHLAGDVLNAGAHEELLRWFIETMAKFRPVTNRSERSLEIS